MQKFYSLCFESQSDNPETSVEMIFRLSMVDVAHQEDTVFNVVNLNAGKWHATASFKDLPAVQMTRDAPHDATLQPMSNNSIELTGHLVTSYEECFSQPNPGYIDTI